MPAPTLTAAQALTDYGLTVSELDLTDAALEIASLTSYTLAEHVDERLVDSASVRRAWAIVADRVRSSTANDEARTLISEQDPDYSYSKSVTLSTAANRSLLAGRPNELLRIEAVFDDYRGDTKRVPPTLDDFGVEFA